MNGASEAQVMPFRIANVLVWKIEDGPPIGVAARELFPDNRLPKGEASRELLLAFNSYVLSLDGKNVLIDTGIGNGKNRGDYPPYSHRQTDFLGQLASCGLSERDIDFVVCTHLHPDHVGWNTHWADGEWQPTFPRATYVFSRKEHEILATQWLRGKRDGWALAAYEDSIAPILRRDRAVFWDRGLELLPGLRFHDAAGHSPDQFYLSLKSLGETAIFSADIFHHVIQIAHPDLVPAYDQDKIAAKAIRRRLFDELAKGDAVMFASHFCGTSAGRIHRFGEGGRFECIESHRPI